MAKNGSISSLFNLQSKSINFNLWSFLAHFWAKYQGYSLTFWPQWLIFISFQSAIKINQFQFWSFWLIVGQNTKAIALLFGQKWLIFITCQSAIKLNQFQFWSFLAHFWAKYQGYSLTFWPQMAHFHHFSICNQTQSISILVIFGSFVGQNTKAIALLFGQKWLIFITFQSAIKINQFQFWSFLAHFGQNTKAIALLFGQKWLIFITFQSAIKINQFQVWSFLAHCWAKYQGYSLTFWPKMAHFHHFSICNQNQSISILVIFGSFLGKIPRL